jgi:hypothetical protein
MNTPTWISRIVAAFDSCQRDGKHNQTAYTKHGDERRRSAPQRPKGKASGDLNADFVRSYTTPTLR